MDTLAACRLVNHAGGILHHCTFRRQVERLLPLPIDPNIGLSNERRAPWKPGLPQHRGFHFDKSTDQPQLMLRLRTKTDDYELLARAWMTANRKARELGWIV